MRRLSAAYTVVLFVEVFTWSGEDNALLPAETTDDWIDPGDGSSPSFVEDE